MNLRALKLLYPEQEQHAVEINADAARELAKVIPPANVHHTSILEFAPDATFEFVLIKGVLIRVHPNELPKVYDSLVGPSKRYLRIAEYDNPSPIAVPYRGHSDRPFKRDFAGEVMIRHPSMSLVDDGFAYRRDPSFLQYDITWFCSRRAREPRGCRRPCDESARAQERVSQRSSSTSPSVGALNGDGPPPTGALVASGRRERCHRRRSRDALPRARSGVTGQQEARSRLRAARHLSFTCAKKGELVFQTSRAARWSDRGAVANE